MSTVRCSVDIYTREGDQYSFQTDRIMSIQTQNNIRSNNESFTIILAPGGPNGSIGSSWAEIIPLMSTVVIAMQRSIYSQVVLVGIVTSVSENQVWNTSSNVTRTTVIQGQGFSYFFKNLSVYALTYLTGFNDLLKNIFPGSGIASLSLAMTDIPINVALQLLQNPMGVSQSDYLGALSVVKINYQDNFLTLPQSVSTVLIDNGFYNIVGTYFLLTNEGTWDAKLRQILEWPFYEYFVMTGPQNFYVLDNAPGYTPKTIFQQAFNSTTLSESIPAYPTFVGRRNPWPYLKGDTSSGFSIDMGLWNNLPQFSPHYGGFISSEVNFSADGVRNVFAINSLFAQDEFANLGETSSPLLFEVESAVNVDSIAHYGFAPEIHFTNLFTNVNQVSTENQETIQNQSYLALQLASWYGPIPHLGRGTITMELRPDIFPGAKFAYVPFRDNTQWTFYIEGVSHVLNFSGRTSTTTLNLERGLPTYVYSDSNLMTQLLTGDLVRLNGTYQTNPSSLPTLQTRLLKNTEYFSNILGNANAPYYKPQP